MRRLVLPLVWAGAAVPATRDGLPATAQCRILAWHGRSRAPARRIMRRYPRPTPVFCDPLEMFR